MSIEKFRHAYTVCMDNQNISKVSLKQPIAYANFDRFLGGISDKTKIIHLLDGIIREDLALHNNDFHRLVSCSELIKKFSGQFKSRIIFAILRSLPSGQSSLPYKVFIKDFCGGNADFCSEGNYARHKAAQEFIKCCSDPHAVKYYESLPEGKIRRYIKKARGIENKSQLLLEFYDSVVKRKPDEKAAEVLFNSTLKKYPTTVGEQNPKTHIAQKKESENAKKKLERLLGALEKKIAPNTEDERLYKEAKNSLDFAFDKLQKLLESLENDDGK